MTSGGKSGEEDSDSSADSDIDGRNEGGASLGGRSFEEAGSGGRAAERTGGASSTDDPVEPLSCPEYGPPDVRSRPQNTLNEASGLVQSRIDPDRYYAHNDSGDSPRLFVLSRTGTLGAILRIDTPFPTDWEDIAAYVDDEGRAWLLIADIGDNNLERPSVDFVFMQEPMLLDESTSYASVRREISYPDGRHNAEAVFVDEQSLRAYVLTKTSPVRIYSLGLTTDETRFEFEGEVGENWPAGLTPTAADLRAEHPWIGVRSEEEAAIFLRQPGESLLDSLNGVPCPFSLSNDVQGEAIAFDEDGNLMTLDEATTPLHFYQAQ